MPHPGKAVMSQQLCT